MFPSPGYAVLVFGFLFFAGTYGCKPGGNNLPTKRPRPTRRTTTTTTRRTTTTTSTSPSTTTIPENTLAIIEPFSMEILPPLAWSVPPLREEFRRLRSFASTIQRNTELQAPNEAEALTRANGAIQNSVDQVTSKYNYSRISVENVSFLLIVADVVEANGNECTHESSHSVILSDSGRTIIKKCDTDNAVKDFDPVFVAGNFSVRTTDFSEEQWKNVAEDLKNFLIAYSDVRFPNGNDIVIGRKETTSTTEVTTERSTTEREEPHPSTSEEKEKTTTAPETTEENSTPHQDPSTSEVTDSSTTPKEFQPTTTEENKNTSETEATMATEHNTPHQETSSNSGIPETTPVDSTSSSEMWNSVTTESVTSSSEESTSITLSFSENTIKNEGTISTTAESSDETHTTDFSVNETSAESYSTDEKSEPTTKTHEFTMTFESTTEITSSTQFMGSDVSTASTPEISHGDVHYLSMEIQPPVAWTYSSEGSEETAALVKIKVDIENEMNLVLSSFDVRVNFERVIGLPIKAEIATIDQKGSCYGNSIDHSVILSENGKTITQKCDVISGKVTEFDFIPVTVFIRLPEEHPAITWKTVMESFRISLENDCFVIFKGPIDFNENTSTEAPFEASPEASFSMNVLPPASWSFPSKQEYLKEYQGETAEEARENIYNNILEAVNEILISYSLPANALNISIDESIAIKADIVEELPTGTCGAVSDFSVVLKPEKSTIQRICAMNGADPIDFPPVVVSGTFSSPATVPLNYWKILVADLKDLLETKDVEFPEGNDISLTL